MSNTIDMVSAEGELPGMPSPWELRLDTVGENAVVSYGRRALACYDIGDRGARRIAIVSLTRAGFSCNEVARVFGIHPAHVSRLRGKANEGGVATLLTEPGRRRKLDARGIARVYEMHNQGIAGCEIAKKLGVSGSVISRLLTKRPVLEADRLPLADTSDGVDTSDGPDAKDGVDTSDGVDASDADDTSGAADADASAVVGVAESDGASGVIAAASASDLVDSSTGVVGGDALAARVLDGGGRSVYAGAMLLHPFLEKVGAGKVLSALDCGPARCYDSAAVALSSMFAFALGSSSLEGSKHLLPADAGLLVGIERFPHLRTLRPRLGALADAVDPLALQVTFAKAMLAADSEPPSVFFVDGHFVAYTGARPVAKGYNTRRRHAEPGRDETVVVDERWRAVCFASGPPEGLCEGMLSPLDQLREICGGRRVMVGFDRGGSFPKAFRALRERDMDWATYRRAPLATPTVKPRRSWVKIDGRRRYLRVADEIVELDKYGEARQLTVYEHGRVALQILTSDLRTPAARLAYVLRCRWRIENSFKYLEDHHGYHWLCDYQMDTVSNDSLVQNPERSKALALLRSHETTVAELERTIGKHTTTPPTDSEPDQTLNELRASLDAARADVQAANATLKPIPAKLPANAIDPDAQLAIPHTNRRALQTVLRLLAYNAELDLARALNTYLTDPDEYRAITRHLLHQPGHINYTPARITVTIDKPHAPRIARALNLLIDQLNSNPPTLAGDTRKIAYSMATT
jgi:Helix-turn-helix domain